MIGLALTTCHQFRIFINPIQYDCPLIWNTVTNTGKGKHQIFSFRRVENMDDNQNKIPLHRSSWLQWLFLVLSCTWPAVTCQNTIVFFVIFCQKLCTCTYRCTNKDRSYTSIFMIKEKCGVWMWNIYFYSNSYCEDQQCLSQHCLLFFL